LPRMGAPSVRIFGVVNFCNQDKADPHVVQPHRIQRAHQNRLTPNVPSA